MFDDIRQAKTVEELCQMLEKSDGFTSPFSGDTPLDDFECREIGTELRRLLDNEKGVRQ